MTLTESDMVAAGNAALRLLSLPERAELDHVYDGWAFIATWLPDDDTIMSSNGIPLGGTRADAAMAVVDALSNDISDTSLYWGVAFPRCPGHLHPADYGITGEYLWLCCPRTKTEIRRVAV